MSKKKEDLFIIDADGKVHISDSLLKRLDRQTDKYIRDMERAHKETGKSKLRFGPARRRK